MKNNKYLTTWEKRMKKAIDSQIDDEIKEKKEQQANQTRVKVLDPDLLNLDKFRKKKVVEYEEVYRRNHTLRVLKKCGLDIEEFLKTWMGSCNRTNMLLGCIQDKIDGFDYNANGLRVRNHKKMNINSLKIGYQDDTLVIEDENNKYEFKVDEHQLIYVDGKKVFDLSEIPTWEENNEDLEEFIEDMREDRLTHERRMQKSLEAARTWRVEE